MARLAQLAQARDRAPGRAAGPDPGARDRRWPPRGRVRRRPGRRRGPGAASAGVSDLAAPRREARAGGERRQAPRWLGAAAAVALVLAGVAGLAVLGRQRRRRRAGRGDRRATTHRRAARTSRAATPPPRPRPTRARPAARRGRRRLATPTADRAASVRGSATSARSPAGRPGRPGAAPTPPAHDALASAADTDSGRPAGRRLRPVPSTARRRRCCDGPGRGGGCRGPRSSTARPSTVWVVGHPAAAAAVVAVDAAAWSSVDAAPWA